MPLIDLLRPDQRAALRRLRKKIANRENMRRYRAENLCAGVDLPLEAGTCGRLVWPESERCIACRKRRAWLPPPRAQPRRGHALAARLESVDDAAAEPGTCPPDPCLRW